MEIYSGGESVRSTRGALGASSVCLSQLPELGEASSERKDTSLPLLGVTSIYSS